jgi:hypothetical protein
MMLPFTANVRAHLFSRSVVVRTVSAGRLSTGVAGSAWLLLARLTAPPVRTNPNKKILHNRKLCLMFMLVAYFFNEGGKIPDLMVMQSSPRGFEFLWLM